MKKILFLLCLAHGSVHAQKMTVAAGGGLAVSSLSGNGASYDPTVNPSCMLSASVALRSFQVGVRADIFNFRAKVTYTDSSGIPREEKIDLFKPSLGISAFAGKVFRHRLIEVSASLTAGIVINNSDGVWIKSMRGVSAGIDIGVAHYVTKSLGIFINASPRYIFQEINAYAFPLNLGLTAKL